MCTPEDSEQQHHEADERGEGQDRQQSVVNVAVITAARQVSFLEAILADEEVARVAPERREGSLAEVAQVAGQSTSQRVATQACTIKGVLVRGHEVTGVNPQKPVNQAAPSRDDIRSRSC